MAEALLAFSLAANIAQFLTMGVKVINRVNAFHSHQIDIPTTLQEIVIQLPIMTDICKKIGGDERTSNMTKRMLPTHNDTIFKRTRKAVNSIRLENKLLYLQRGLETYKSTLLLHSRYTSISPRDLGSKRRTLHHFPSTPSCQFVERVKPLKALNDIFSATLIKHAGPRFAIL